MKIFPHMGFMSDVEVKIDDVVPVAGSALEMAENAAKAVSFLKALSHEGRLMILCYLVSGEKSVSEIEEFVEMRQASVSQLLARLRDDGLVEARREGKSVYYSLIDARTSDVISMLHGMFCAPNAPRD